MNLKIIILIVISIFFINRPFNSLANENKIGFNNLKYRNVGPTRGGRVTSVHGVESLKYTFYMGTTGGGLWKTTDAGTTWKNISDGFFKSPSIGAINVYQKNPNIIYVGTGTDGLRSNLIVGKGMYKSTDAGKSWNFIGLNNAGQIGAVEIDPNNQNNVYVAAIGQPFQKNKERGLYKTIDGGKSWKKILFISDSIGIVDVELAPDNSNIIYAASWRAERKPWTIISGSLNGGIYKSVDAGNTWMKLSDGLPKGYIGKIDLAVSKEDPNKLYAMIEASDGKGGIYRSVDRGKSFKLMNSREELVNRPFYYLNVESNPKNSNILYSSANRFMISNNGGKTWKSKSTPHGDNHDIWINPNDTSIWIQSNDGGANITFNSGKTWTTQFNQPTAELYQVEVDDQYPYWLYAGQQDNSSTIAVPSRPPYGVQAGPNAYIINTGGCETGPAVPKPGNHNIVYSNCKGRFGVYNKLTGQEMQYYVGASNIYGHNPKDLKYRFQRVAPIFVSSHNPNVIYHGSQYLHKTIDDGKTWKTISPDLTAFEDDKQVISGSPITRDITGEEYYSTIYSIRESPLVEGILWIGSNDGPIHLTKDGGITWLNVTPDDLNNGGRVDSVEPSHFKKEKAYVTILRYQLGDWKPYIYKTLDFGESWELITNGIPNNYPVRVLREDPIREGLLYAGTEFGMYVSYDDGKNWESLQLNLPVTPVTDIKIHRGNLILSTMGRSFWILDNINLLRYNLSEDMNLYPVNNSIRYRDRYRNTNHISYSEPSIDFDYLVNSNIEKITFSIYNSNNNLINSYSSVNKEETIEEYSMSTNDFISISSSLISLKQGINRFHWNMRHKGSWHNNVSRSYRNGPLVKPGNYKVVMQIDDKKFERNFSVLADPRLSHINDDTYVEQENFLLETTALLSDLRQFEFKLNNELNNNNNNKKRIKQLKLIKNKISIKEGPYMQPMLINQLSYLMSMLSRADQKPGNDAYIRLDEIKSKFNLIQNDYNVLD